MRRRAVQLLGIACVVSVCVACSAGHTAPRPAPLPTTSVPTVQQLIDAYASTLASERFRFDSKASDAEYVGTLDLAHNGLDISLTGAGQTEIRFLGSHQWARNLVGTSDPQMDALLNVPGPLTSTGPSPLEATSDGVSSPADSQTWLIIPFSRGVTQSQLPLLGFPSAAELTGLDRTGASAVQGLGAANVKGTATVGYQWTVTLPTALDSVAKTGAGSEVQILMRLDPEGRVAQLQLTPVAGVTPSSAPPAPSAAPDPAFASLDFTLTLYDFDSTPPITAPPNPITADQFNAQH